MCNTTSAKVYFLSSCDKAVKKNVTRRFFFTVHLCLVGNSAVRFYFYSNCNHKILLQSTCLSKIAGEFSQKVCLLLKYSEIALGKDILDIYDIFAKLSKISQKSMLAYKNHHSLGN